MHLTFLGAAGTVTGSRFLVSRNGTRVLVDCGLFQGPKALRQKNWNPLPIDASAIDAIVLTHAHIDHSGWLPRVVAQGFRGPVFCTAATADLCGLLLPDSARLQEEDARWANARGFSKHKPALPLYTEAEAAAALKQLVPCASGAVQGLPEGFSVSFRPAGHILGASWVVLDAPEHRLVFSGDLGRDDDPLMNPPELPDLAADTIVCESTYGDRFHPRGDALTGLAEVVRRTAERGGIVLVPAFAVGRVQTLLLALHRLAEQGEIPRDLPLYVDSPMAVDATGLYLRHADAHRLSADEVRAMCGSATLVRSVDESKALQQRRGPAVILSASGMLTGGRVLHHLEKLAGDPRNTILFAGFQAVGTRGHHLQSGARRIKLHGRYLDVQCEIARMDSWSAHGDQDDLLRWLGGFTAPPGKLWLTHGEPGAIEALRVRVKDALGWDVEAAELGAHVALAPRRGESLPPLEPGAPVAPPVPRVIDVEGRRRQIAASPSYRRVEADPEFLASPGALPAHLLLEYVKVEQGLAGRGISDTIVVWGGTRVIPEDEARTRLEDADLALASAPGEPALQQRVLVARRVLAHSRWYEEARAFGRLASEHTLPDGRRGVVMTGGGPGVMEAANRGAFEAGAPTIGLNITLPREQQPNPYLTADLCFHLNSFAVRKLHFIQRARAFVAFPGGYGTLDELTDALTLIQTGKIPRIPIVLVGRLFWQRAFPGPFLADEGMIAPEDADLVRYADSGEQAWELVCATR